MKVIAIIWSYVLPVIVFIFTAVLLTRISAEDRTVRRAILKAGEIVLSERDLQRKKDGRIITWLSDFLSGLGKFTNIEKLLGYELKKMLILMGEKKSPERVYADHILTALLAASILFAIPLLTGFTGYILLYPLGVIAIIFGQAKKVKQRFHQWQNDIIRDIPELIDKMRISLASGKDYISALRTVQENSGPRLSTILDKLINDMQIMKPSQALDEFAATFGMPVMVKFVAAVKVGIETGYEQSENYFINIEQDIRELRRLALEELTRNKPEKTILLKAIMIFHAIAALGLTTMKLFSEINRII
ncbi:hypothetical protein [Phosphitispora sp. TUW77]|uniref:hypothetical protein n=1 Tax=Phosphitispora sp. TUW77 TaxID=3152361 RepID=UPI003AB1B14D